MSRTPKQPPKLVSKELKEALGIADNVIPLPAPKPRPLIVVAWPDVNREGDPKKTYRNARAAIAAMGHRCAYDDFHDRMLIDNAEVSDATVTALRQDIIDKCGGHDLGREHIGDALNALCLENKFNPILDYLEGLEWDEVKRLDAWVVDYLGANDTPLNREIGRLTLVAAVRRVRQPGVKFDHIPTLEGAEGTGKSRAVEVLAGTENFSDQTILTQSEKEQQELVRGVWIFEIAELTGMRRAEVEKIKAFASRTHDRARPAYGRRRVDAPRRCIFIATTNEDEYLKSQTGNRRIWPIQTGTIDIEALRKDRDQLWAEAVEIEAQGEPLILPRDLWADAKQAQDARREHDPWDDILSAAAGTLYATTEGDEERISTATLLGPSYLNISAATVQWHHYQRLKHAMHRLGWKGPALQSFGARQDRGYSRKARMQNS